MLRPVASLASISKRRVGAAARSTCPTPTTVNSGVGRSVGCAVWVAASFAARAAWAAGP